MPLGRAISKGLVYTIDLSKIADRANPRTVETPISGITANRPFTVDWGDGTTTDFPAGASPFPTHEYAAAGVYTVTIRSATGQLPRLLFSGDTSSTVTHNLTLALTSLDHHGGESYNASQQFVNVFRNAANCTYVDPRFGGQPGWTAYSNAYRDSGLTQRIESFCFDFVTQVSSFNSTFFGVSGLTGSIPAGFFDNNTVASVFASTFQGCSGLTGSIPQGLFNNNLLASNFGYTFQGCSGLTGSIPEGLFDNNTETTSFNSTFYGCVSLTGSIPEDLFDNNTAVKNFNYTFRSCRNLTPPPIELWDAEKWPSVTEHSDTYRDCSAAMRALVPTDWGGTMTVN